MATEDLEFRVMKNILRLLNSLPDDATRDRVFAYVSQKVTDKLLARELEAPLPVEHTVQ